MPPESSKEAWKKAVHDTSEHFSQIRKLLVNMEDAKMWNLTSEDLHGWAKEIGDHLTEVEEQLTKISPPELLSESPAGTQISEAATPDASWESRTSPSPSGLKSQQSFRARPPLDRRQPSERPQLGQNAKGASPRSANLARRLKPQSPHNTKEYGRARQARQHSPAAAGTHSGKAAEAQQQSPRGNQVDLSSQQYVSAAIHLMLEAICYRLRAERCCCLKYIPRIDELQGVGLVGSDGVRPHSIRVTAHSGIAGSVFQSGVAVNVSNLHDGDEPHIPFLISSSTPKHSPNPTVNVMSPGKDTVRDRDFLSTNNNLNCSNVTQPSSTSNNNLNQKSKPTTMLSFPLRTLHSQQQMIGVVQVFNCVDKPSFTADDEACLNSYCVLLAYLLDKYPLDSSNGFDATKLHSIVPFSIPVEEDAHILPPIMSRFGGHQLIYRTTQSGQYIRRNDLKENGVNIEGGGTAFMLKEVDSYMANLEECWRRTVAMTVELEHNAKDASLRMNMMKDDLRKARQKVHVLKQQLHKYEPQDPKPPHFTVRDLQLLSM